MSHTKVLFLVFFSPTWLFAMASAIGIQEHKFADGIGPVYITPETRLHNYLFPRREPKRTHPNIGTPVDVDFKITLLSVVDIEDANEVIVINANIMQKWVNPTYKWNKDYFGGITRINVRPEMTWVPDIYVHANVEDDKKYNGLLDTLNTQIIVNNNGLHEWLATVTFRMSCSIDVKDYPFDTQRCPLKFGSLTLDSTKMNLNPLKVDITQYGESPEWVFVSMGHEKVFQTYPGSEDQYAEVIYTVAMRRKPLYPMTMLVLPNLMLAGMTILVFHIPIMSGERVMFIFTIFLAVAWYMTSNLDNMPNSSQAISLYTYFLAANVVGLSCLCLSLCATIVCFYTDPGITAMPKWVREYILKQCSKIFGFDVDQKTLPWRKELEVARQYDYMFVAEDDLNSTDGVIDNSNIDPKCQHTGDCNNSTPPPPLGSLWGGKPDKGQSLDEILSDGELRSVHAMVESFLQRLESMEDSQWEQREWELVANILDSMFLYFFTSVLVLTVFSCTIHVVKLEGFI